MKTTIPLCLSFLSFGLFVVAQNETEPACVSECMRLRNEIYSECSSYDIFTGLEPTGPQAGCICGGGVSQESYAPCLECLVEDDPERAQLYTNFCPTIIPTDTTSAPTSTGNSTRTSAGPTTIIGDSNSTATQASSHTSSHSGNATTTATNTITGSATSTRTSTRTTDTSESTDTSSSDQQPTSSPAPGTGAASGVVPGVALAFVLFVAQMAL